MRPTSVDVQKAVRSMGLEFRSEIRQHLGVIGPKIVLEKERVQLAPGENFKTDKKTGYI